MARAPLRISFAGGGTDIEPYCTEYGGCVLSVAIKKYVYAVYPSIHEGESSIERTIVNYLKPDNEGMVEITNDAPPMSGLGGSATCFVAGIKAIEPSLKKRKVAELAFRLERDIMGIAGGKQDQYMSAYGGLSLLEFTDKVKVTQLPIAEGFEDLFILVYMGLRHDAGQDIIRDQMKRLNKVAFNKQKTIVYQMVGCLKDKNWMDFGKLLDEAWHSKLEFSPLVANEEIKDFYYDCLKWGAIGGKLTGAGGGGYMLLMANPEKPEELKLKLWGKRVDFEQVKFERAGVICRKKQ